MENGFNKTIEELKRDKLNERKKEILQDLVVLRNYNDEIPEDLITTDMPNYELYKCKTNFFTSVRLGIEEMKRKELLLSKEAIQKSEEFLNSCAIKKSSDRYEPAHIVLANETLDILIKELS